VGDGVSLLAFELFVGLLEEEGTVLEFGPKIEPGTLWGSGGFQWGELNTTAKIKFIKLLGRAIAEAKEMENGTA
jgi:hypothetical protein